MTTPSSVHAIVSNIKASVAERLLPPDTDGPHGQGAAKVRVGEEECPPGRASVQREDGEVLPGEEAAREGAYARGRHGGEPRERRVVVAKRTAVGETGREGRAARGGRRVGARLGRCEVAP